MASERMQNREAGSTEKLNDNERYGSGEPEKSKKKYKFEKKFLGGVFWSNTFLVCTYEKKMGKTKCCNNDCNGFFVTGDTSAVWGRFCIFDCKNFGQK
jgi:hypothetical protein